MNDEPPYAQPLREEDLGPEPLGAFRGWFREAAEAGIHMPEAMAVATATPGGAPSARMVLLKEFDERGFVFYTNYESRKGRDLAANSMAALLFYWDALGRQVRIEGAVARVAREESEAYFASRPEGSRIGAIASRQSEPIDGRRELEERVTELEREFAGKEVPLPEHWGGFRVAPGSYEFWQHRDDRLHDRIRYVRVGSAWLVERLQP
jgi:pyridoxamine 5'-phosphate oxidase